HVVSYHRDELPQLLEQINASGYGLTLGVHTRIDETIAQVVDSAQVGNLYVNRNIVGAVVGVQPFGGECLSGTGPKAGGPLYLYRLLSARPADAVVTHLRGESQNAQAPELPAPQAEAFTALREWAQSRDPALSQHCERFAGQALSGLTLELAGPTGERNTYAVKPRSRVLCLA